LGPARVIGKQSASCFDVMLSAVLSQRTSTEFVQAAGTSNTKNACLKGDHPRRSKLQ
jgi:hypothetical protein